MFRDESNHVIKKAIHTSSKPPRVRPSVSSRKSYTKTSPTPPTSSQNNSPSNSPSVRSSLLGILPARDGPSPRGTTVPSPSMIPEDRKQASSHESQSPQMHQKPPVLTLDFLPPSLQERGTAYFFSRFVTPDNAYYQNYDFIYDIWKPPRTDSPNSSRAKNTPTDCVTASMIATGLAGLAKLTRCQTTMTQARQCYGVGLKLTSAALQDPVSAVKDTTMLAALILGTYEFVSGRTPQTMRAWKEHVNGASALASLRGTEQFRTSAGSRMFVMLCNSVLISCIRSEIPMPKVMIDLREKQGKICNLNGPAWRVVDPIYRALQVRHDIKMGKITETDHIISELLEVEDHFCRTASELPTGWTYRNVQLSRPNPEVLGSYCHIYPGLQQAITWNGMRIMRMLVQETIVEQLSALGPPTSLPLHHQVNLIRAMKLLRRMGDAVVASVPQYLGIISSRDIDIYSRAVPSLPSKQKPYELISAPSVVPGSPDKVRNSMSDQQLLSEGLSLQERETDAERFMTLATTSDTIVLPLYTVGTSSSCTAEMRHYIVEKLNTIYRESGLEQARVVRIMMEENVPRLKWEDIPLRDLPVVMDDDLPITV